MEYFYHYKLTPEKLDILKKEVNCAVENTQLFVDPIDDNISTQISPQYHFNDPDGIQYLPMTIQTIGDIVCDSRKVKEHALSLVSAWTVYGKKGGYHTVHKHSGQQQNVCTVTYLDVQPEEYPLRNGTFFFFIGGELKEMAPESGDIYIFSNNMYHGTYPQDRDHRHTLSMDWHENYIS